MRSGRKLALAMNSATGGACLSKMSVSTEDLWHEDAYIPEQYILSSPDYKVSLSTVQPDVPQLCDVVCQKSLPTRPMLTNMPVCLLEPPRQFQSPCSDSDEGNSRETFDNILSSLQGLADSLSADFALSSQESLCPAPELKSPKLP